MYVWIGSSLGKQHRSRWLTTQLIIVTAFAPWVLISLAQKKTSPEIIAWISGSLAANLVLAEIVTKLTRVISVPELPFGWLSVVLAYSLLAFGAISLRADRPNLFLLCLGIVFPLVGVLLMDQLLGTRGISITRYWMVTTPALYLLMSVGVERIKKWLVQIALIAVLGGFLFAAALLTARGELRARPDRHKEMAQFVDNQIFDANQIVLTEGLNSIPLALAYYGQREMNILRYKRVADQLRQQSFSQITGGQPTVWLLVSGQSRAAKLLEANGFRLEGTPVMYGHILIAKYILQRRDPATSNNLNN